MIPHSNMPRARIGEVDMCLLCRNREIAHGPEDDSSSLPQLKSSLVGVCRYCQERYLSIGVALVNPETQSVIVITESAFKAIFDQPIPEQKIVRVEEAVIEKVYGLFLVSQEARANIARARRAMLN